MTKVFLDTNIFLRFFIRQEEKQFEACSALLLAVEQGKIRPYTSNIVMLECYYVLDHFYHVSRVRLSELLDRIVNMRNMTLIDTSDTPQALRLWRQTGIKFTDCLIATQIGKGTALCTYDKDFEKLSSLEVVSPEGVLNT